MTADAQDKWKRLFPKWSTMFLLDPADPKSGTWLDSKWSQGLSVGCKCCNAAERICPFGVYGVASTSALQVANFRKHAASDKHVAAAAAFISGIPDMSCHCPPVDKFKQAAVDIMGGAPLEGQVRHKLVWCLSEAIKEQDRSALLSARAIALFRDERKGRLAMRFKAVDADLVESSGSLGQEREFGTGATNISAATQRIITRMCTRFSGCIGQSVAVETMLPKLLEHFRQTVMCITVDSARDEVLSGEMMRCKALSCEPQQMALTPNLKFVIRDKAHASRRIISRPWAADDFLWDIINMMCKGKGSISRMLEHSPEIRRVFSDFVKNSASQVVESSVTNMRAACHRFESFQKPLGRTCLHMHAVIRTALHVSLRGQPSVALLAKAWLRWVDTEKFLMLSMMADVADEAMSLTRLLDKEGIDPAILNREVNNFKVTVTALFSGNSPQCLNVFGYTSVMMTLLRQQVVWQVGRETFSIGFEEGVPANIVDRCLDRMRSYCVLAHAALEAEFPCFEISQSFQVFDVSSPMPTDADVHLQRLACPLGLDPVTLKAQWQDIFPRAQNQARETGGTNREAWHTVLNRLASCKALRDAHPTAVLREALIAYFAFSISSSGVEQKFSKGALRFTDRQACAKAETEEMYLKVCLDFPERDADAICTKAQQVWKHCFSPCLPRTLMRLDKGTKRKRPAEEENGFVARTEKDFLAKRRAAAKAASACTAKAASACAESAGGSAESAAAKAASACAVSAGADWCETHEKELLFLQRKRNDKVVDAFAESSLLPFEVTPQVRAEAAAKHSQRVVDAQVRTRKAERDKAAAQGLSLSAILGAIRCAGKAIFVAPACRSKELGVALGNHGLRSASILEAEVFVVQFPGQAGICTMAASAMRGAYQLSPKVLLSGIGDGVALKMKPACNQPKTIYISPACATSQAQFCAFVQGLLANIKGSKWKIEFADWAALKAAVRTPTMLVALVLSTELGVAPFKYHKHTYTVETFIAMISAGDMQRSWSGLRSKKVLTHLIAGGGAVGGAGGGAGGGDAGGANVKFGQRVGGVGGEIWLAGGVAGGEIWLAGEWVAR